MAGSKTDAFEQRVLDHIFKNGATPALPALATVYVALFTVVPSDPSPGTEVSGSSYARQAVAAAAWTRTASSMSNNAVVAFPAVTASAYTVVGWAIMDALTVGNMLYCGDTTSTVMNVGDVAQFAANAITVTED
jgi:hypothetical protein